MVKLIAFDLDGTFLDDRKHIPEENLRAIRYAAEKGAVVVPATGRLFLGIPEELASLPFLRYYILINGAKVYDAKEDKIISAAEIPVDTALDLFRHGKEIGAIYDCYMDDTGYMEAPMRDALDEYSPNKAYIAYMKSIRRPVDNISEFIRDKTSVQKVQYFFKDLDERARQLKLIPELFPGIKASSSVSMNIEMNSVNAGKGPALAALCCYLGFSPEDAVAFGDGMNDADMLSAAGLGIAMKNSDPDVLAYADRITDFDNNEAGVAKMIYEIV